MSAIVERLRAAIKAERVWSPDMRKRETDGALDAVAAEIARLTEIERQFHALPIKPVNVATVATDLDRLEELRRCREQVAEVWALVRQNERNAYGAVNSLDAQELDARLCEAGREIDRLTRERDDLRGRLEQALFEREFFMAELDAVKGKPS